MQDKIALPNPSIRGVGAPMDGLSALPWTARWCQGTLPWAKPNTKSALLVVFGDARMDHLLFRIVFFQELLYSSIFGKVREGLMNKLIVPAVIVAFGVIAAAALSQQAQPPASGFQAKAYFEMPLEKDPSRQA